MDRKILFTILMAVLSGIGIFIAPVFCKTTSSLKATGWKIWREIVMMGL